VNLSQTRTNLAFIAPPLIVYSPDTFQIIGLMGKK
jgi:hypothetical protein